MTNETLTEAESLSEKAFKNVLENKVLVLLKHGKWTVNTAKLESDIKVLKYNDQLGLFVHANKVEVVASGYVIELTDKYLIQKVKDYYFTIKEVQDAEAQAVMQKRVLETMNKLTSFLEIK